MTPLPSVEQQQRFSGIFEIVLSGLSARRDPPGMGPIRARKQPRTDGRGQRERDGRLSDCRGGGSSVASSWDILGVRGITGFLPLCGTWAAKSLPSQHSIPKMRYIPMWNAIELGGRHNRSRVWERVDAERGPRRAALKRAWRNGPDLHVDGNEGARAGAMLSGLSSDGDKAARLRCNGSQPPTCWG
jgi:hypothetical protein